MKAKKWVTVVVALMLSLCLATALTACGGSGGAKNPGDSVKIGVLVSDVSGDESVAFKKYYSNYLSSQYPNVSFIYSDAMADAAAEKTQIERFAGQNCDAIISFAAGDRAAQITACQDAGIYYAIATGMLDETEYEQYKEYTYFVGQIGPSMDTEYQAGLAMGQYYKSTMNYKNIALYGAFIPNPMHSYRMAGTLTGLGLTYDGASGKDIVGKIGASFDVSKIGTGDVSIAGYVGGYSDAMFGTMGGIMANADALLSVGMSTTFFADMLDEMNKPYSDIDAFTVSNGKHMKDGKLNYLAGKYASSIGPIFAATMSAVYGAPIRNDGGNAISLSQGYWVATTSAEFLKFQGADTDTNPIFTKALLDTVIAYKDNAVSYSNFKTLVETDRTPA